MTPADIVLQAFRAWKSDAYVCCPDVGRWRADCPVCGDHHMVRIVEQGDGGPVRMWCLRGCSQERIVDALRACEDTAPADDPRDQLEQANETIQHLLSLADEMLEAQLEGVRSALHALKPERWAS